MVSRENFKRNDPFERFSPMKKIKKPQGQSRYLHSDNEELKPLPYLNPNMNPRQQEAVFISKLRQCCVLFHFETPDIDSEGKKIKCNALKNIIHYLSYGRNVLTDAIYPEIVDMFACNIFHTLPPHEFADVDAKEIIFEKSWTHLNLVYEVFLSFLESQDFQSFFAVPYINEKFIIQLLKLFDSVNRVERQLLKIILHRIYNRCVSLRETIKREVKYVLIGFINGTEHLNGINEILNFMESLIIGFAVPLKFEYKEFMIKVLVPLHKKENLPSFYEQLSACMMPLIKKEPLLCRPVIRGLLRIWPKSSARKETIYLNEIEVMIEEISLLDFYRVQKHLFRQISKCVSSPHYQVAKHALNFCRNKYVVNLIMQNCDDIMPLIVPAVNDISKHYWNKTILLLSRAVLIKFQRMNPGLFSELIQSEIEELARRGQAVQQAQMQQRQDGGQHQQNLEQQQAEQMGQQQREQEEEQQQQLHEETQQQKQGQPEHSEQYQQQLLEQQNPQQQQQIHQHEHVQEKQEDDERRGQEEREMQQYQQEPLQQQEQMKEEQRERQLQGLQKRSGQYYQEQLHHKEKQQQQQACEQKEEELQGQQKMPQDQDEQLRQHALQQWVQYQQNQVEQDQMEQQQQIQEQRKEQPQEQQRIPQVLQKHLQQAQLEEEEQYKQQKLRQLLQQLEEQIEFPKLPRGIVERQESEVQQHQQKAKKQEEKQTQEQQQSQRELRKQQPEEQAQHLQQEKQVGLQEQKQPEEERELQKRHQDQQEEDQGQIEQQLQQHQLEQQQPLEQQDPQRQPQEQREIEIQGEEKKLEKVFLDEIDPYNLCSLSKKIKTKQTFIRYRNSKADALERLPPLKYKQSAIKQEQLLIRKLRQCCTPLNFVEPITEWRAKLIKYDTLSELSIYITRARGVLTETVYPEIINMVSCNIFRTLPPQDYKDFDNDVNFPIIDSAWPSLQLVYDVFSSFLYSKAFRGNIAENFIDEKFISELLELFDSEDERERVALKNVLHRIYSNCVNLREFIKKHIVFVLLTFIYETKRFSGVGELLEVLASIVKGFAVPLKIEYKRFLFKVLLPMHKLKSLSLYHEKLSYCVLQFLIKDPLLAEPFIKGLLNIWPRSHAQKEAMFLVEIDEILSVIILPPIKTIQERLFITLFKCLSSTHFLVARYARHIWNKATFISAINKDNAIFSSVKLEEENFELINDLINIYENAKRESAVKEVRKKFSCFESNRAANSNVPAKEGGAGGQQQDPNMLG
uniref:Serine/threonine protein phosphatase 2A regulatory subunit n=1 Tax=Glossina pallidipes TaxID=7398 RepID=A0A1B0AK82_GLOPL